MHTPLDQRQVTRIESVHRGFLYQHLYAAGCLLLAGERGVRYATVEFDEDVELELVGGDRIYIQVKTRLAPLVLSDIAGALDRFDQIRLLHEDGTRSGNASFVILANVAPGPELRARVDANGLPVHVQLVHPGATAGMPACLPPAWTDVAEAITWCADRARTLPMATLEPETLVWKLAGRVMLAAAGHTPGHVFKTADLHTLFEQLIVQLQHFPAPPDVYRPLEDEPQLMSDSRVRIVTGLSGAGKTAWAARAAVHLAGECAYYDVGDVPGPAIAASLVRELAAQWAAPTAGGLRQILLPGRSGIESLRALDRFLGENTSRAIVVLDNTHRIPANDLRLLVDATQHLQFVLLAQPSASIAELEATSGIQQELLRGWAMDEAAAEVHAQGARASPLEVDRLLALTGGLPLFVRTAAQLSTKQYGGDVAAMCAAVEANTNLVETAQELLLRRSFDALPDQVRDCAAVLSLSDVPISEAEAARLVSATCGLDTPAFAASIRQLRSMGVVRTYGAKRLTIHDAFRVVGLRRYGELPKQIAMAGRTALKELILESFQSERDPSRFPLFIRTLVELGELKILVEIATEEWFHEIGVDSGIWDALEAATTDDRIDPEQRFYAFDGLVFAGMKSGDLSQIDRQLQAMEALVAEHGLGDHERMVVLLKRMVFESTRGDEAAMRDAMERAKATVPATGAYQRVFKYNTALALFKVGRHAEAEAIARRLVDEYFELIGLTPLEILGLSNRKISGLLKPTPTLHDDLKHLADTLDVVARTSNAQGQDSGFARIHAAKFYSLANAVDSFINVTQDLVDEFVGRGDYVGARQVIEQQLLPVVIEQRMLSRIVAVRSQYAVVLGYCRDYDAADAEFARLDPYLAGLAHEQRAEIDNQRRLVAIQRRLGTSGSVFTKVQAAAAPKAKVGRNEACPCGSGLKFKRCHGRA